MSFERESWAVRLYERLVRLYPSSLRDGHDEMIAVFRDADRDAEGHRLRRCCLVLLALLDLLVCHLSPMRPVRPLRPVRSRVGSWALARLVEEAITDARLAVRGFRRAPGFGAVAVLVLTLGIGANTTIFSLVDRLFLEPPPHVEEPERLVRIVRTSKNVQAGAMAYPDVADYRRMTRTLEGLMAYDPSHFAVTLGHGDSLHGARGWFVTDNYFDLLGVQMALGRSFQPEENESLHPVVVVSWGLWQTELGGRDDAVGSVLSLNGHSYTVIGVAPRGFFGISPIESPPDLWVPIVTQPQLAPVGGDYALERVPDTTWVWLQAVGRLAPDASIDQAQAEFQTLGQRLEEQYPEWNEGVGAGVSGSWRLHPRIRSGVLLPIARLLSLVVLVLLVVVVANLAILVLARSAARRRETGVRLALGASRGRVLRQQVVENLVLAVAGGGLGFLAARIGADFAASLLPTRFAEPVRPSVDMLVLSFLLAAVVAVLGGSLPALSSARKGVSRVLREGHALSGRSWLRSSLVVVQVALSILLVAGALLFGRSLSSARSVDLGFDTEHRALATVDLRNHGYDDERGASYVREVLDRLRAEPGMIAASTTMTVPFRGYAMTSVVPEGLELGEQDSEPSIGFNVVSPGYFEVMSLDLRRGRGFARRDSATAPGVMVVNEELARRYWPGEDAIGKTVRFDEGEPAFEVVGVVEDAEYYELGEEQQLQFYVPLEQQFFSRVHFVVESRLAPVQLERRLEALMLEVDPEVTVGGFETLEQVFAEEISRYRTAAVLVTMFGGLALVLAMIGLYGVLSYVVLQRRREIGVRMALGATAARVAREILSGGLRLVAIGVVLGLAAGTVLARFVRSFLYGVETTDLATWVLAPIALLLVATLASCVPALRAARVDPVEAIRGE